MKTARLLTMTHLFFLFIVSVVLPFDAYSAAYANLLSWTGWLSSSKAIEKRTAVSEGISKLSFIGSGPPLLLAYGGKTVDENIKTVSELEDNQLYIVLNSQPGDLFNFCFRTPPAFSSGTLPYPPVITKPLTGQSMPHMQNGGVRLIALAPDSDRWQHEYLARWRLPPGNQSLVLSIEDNESGWVLEPECSGIVSESTGSPSSLDSSVHDGHNFGDKKKSSVDIIFRNTETLKNEPDHPEDKSRLSGALAIPVASDSADNHESFTSSGGGGFGGGNDFDDLFKKRPGNGMAPLYYFEWMSELVSSMVLMPDNDGQTVKKRIWDSRIVLKIKQGWNEQTIIISQALWDRISRANLERSSELFLALSRSPDDPEAAFNHYLDSNRAQPLQTEDYSRYAQQGFILSPEQLRSVSVFPGYCPTGTGCSGGTSQVEKEMAGLGMQPPTYTQSQRDYGRHNQGSRGGRNSGGDDGSGGSPNAGLCQKCRKPVLAFNKCRECLNRESDLVELEATEEPLAAIRRDKEMPVSEAKDFNTSAIHVFRWFQSLRFNEKKRGGYFRTNDFCNLPELYNLLSHGLASDKNNLSKFHSKWVEFTKGNLELYHLISEVGELAKSQGGDDYVEVTRIIKSLALYSNIYESEVALKLFRNELLHYLKSNDLLVSDDWDQVYYSGLTQQKKASLINFIYQVFKITGRSLQEEIVPSEYKTIVMFNRLARDIYAEYNFGLPDINDQGEGYTIMWGYPDHIQYSFITRSNMNRLREGRSHQALQKLALDISGDESSGAENVRAMFTALVIIRSMFAERLRKVFPEHAFLLKDVPRVQLEFLRTFTLKAREQLVEVLKLTRPEKKDEFVRNMFLVFGMVPEELSQEWSPLFVPSEQAAAHKEDVQNVSLHADVNGSGGGWQVVGDSRALKSKKKKRSGSTGRSVAGYPPCAARYRDNSRPDTVQGQQAKVDIGQQFRRRQSSTRASLQLNDSTRGNDFGGVQLNPAPGKKVKLTPLAVRPRYDTPLIDIGANLVGNNRFHNLSGVLADAVRSGVGTVIITGTSIPISGQVQDEVMKWVESSPVSDRVTGQATAIDVSSDASRCSLYYTVGCHPHKAKDFLKDGGIPAIKEILEKDHSRCVAVGECGLDYDRNFSDERDQREAFRQQLALAVEMKKPLFLHERDAHDDFKEILEGYIGQLPAKNMACVHCFTGNGEALQDYIDMGCSIGITGWIAGNNNRDLVEALSTVGWDVLRDRLMIETDAPFLRPFQVMSRKDNPKTDNKKRVDNVPANLPYVVHALSEVLGVDAEEIAAASTRNARKIFSLFDVD